MQLVQELFEQLDNIVGFLPSELTSVHKCTYGQLTIQSWEYHLTESDTMILIEWIEGNEQIKCRMQSFNFSVAKDMIHCLHRNGTSWEALRNCDTALMRCLREYVCLDNDKVEPPMTAEGHSTPPDLPPRGALQEGASSTHSAPNNPNKAVPVRLLCRRTQVLS